MENPSLQMFRESLGRLIRNERESQGLSLRKFGLMIGLDYKRVYEIEHGTANATINTLMRISSGLGVPLSEFIYAAEKMSTPPPKQERPKREHRAHSGLPNANSNSNVYHRRNEDGETSAKVN